LCEKLEKYKLPLIFAALCFAAAFPFLFTSRYTIRVATVCLMYVMITLSLNLMVGFLGQMSFGHAAFFGIGAYTSAILTTSAKAPSFFAFAAAGVMAGLFGLLLGLPVLKLKGYYFTIVTMVFCEIIRIAELNWMSLTRGPLGIMAIPKPSLFGLRITTPAHFYFLILIFVILTAIIIKNIMDSRIGHAILAVRDDELAAESMGIPIFRCKMIVFIISSLLAGIAGAFYASYTGFIDPSSFSATQSNEMLVMVIFGGLGSIAGSFIGAIALSVLPELLRGFMQYRLLIYGALLVMLMMLKPQGLLGDINFKYIRQRMNKDKESA
jgi:branched-chain amino acid transport system permease protein